MINDICQICGGTKGQHFNWCDREARMSPEERALVERLSAESEVVRRVDAPLRLSLLLEQAFQVVDSGGKLTIVGSGPFSDPTSHRYSATLTSHTGARGANGTGKTVADCMAALLEQWGRL